MRQYKPNQKHLLNSDDEIQKVVNELLKFTTKSPMLLGFDSNVFERFVDYVIVFSREEIGFELKCGITLKERLVI